MANYDHWAHSITTYVLDRSPSSVVVFDVGANDGGWTVAFSKRLRRNVSRTSVTLPPLRVILLEPQRAFHERLQAIADERQGELIRAAAWVSETNLTFYSMSGKASVAATASTAHAGSLVGATRVTVPAIDFARFLHRRTKDASALYVLKLDVEGAEYRLLPRLLATGGLCHVHYLYVEWHLRGVPSGERLDALMLRKMLERLLQQGCSQSPRLVLHEEVWHNGVAGGYGGGVEVPGLDALARQYSGRPY